MSEALGVAADPVEIEASARDRRSRRKRAELTRARCSPGVDLRATFYNETP